MNQTMITVEDISQTLKLLSDKTRLTIVKILEQRECCVCELVEIFHVSQPAISQHLRKIKDAGLVKENRKGQWIYYSLNTEFKHWDLVLDLLNHVPSQEHELKELEKNSPDICCE